MSEFVIALTVEPLAEGGFLATSPAWDELLAQGRTIAETLEIAQDVARKLIESYHEHGEPLPDGLEPQRDTGVTLTVHITVPAAA